MDTESGDIEGSTRITVGDQLYWALHRTDRILMLSAILAIFLAALDLYRPLMDGYDLSATEIFSAILWPFLIAAPLLMLWVLFLCGVLFFRLSSDQKHINWRINDQTLTISDATGGKTTMPWAQVKRIKERRFGFVVQIKPYGARYIPKRTFNPKDLDWLRDFASEHGHLKPKRSAQEQSTLPAA